MKLTETELGFLDLMTRYGDGLDVTAARMGKALKSAATSLLASGHLSGKRKSLSLTDLGRRALEQSQSQSQEGK